MIHTNIFMIKLRGLKRDMEPKAMRSPRGIAPIRVTKNNFNVWRKPTFNAEITVGICCMINSISISYFLLF